ncbi:Aerobic glycerol-3-phosphate dehydrogenase [compost metagenome]
MKQLEVGMVAEVGKERDIVYQNGPHVTTPEWMMLPCYKGGTFGMFSTSLGLRVYDFLAGVKASERRSMLNAIETLKKEPLLKSEGLLGSGRICGICGEADGGGRKTGIAKRAGRGMVLEIWIKRGSLVRIG